MLLLLILILLFSYDNKINNNNNVSVVRLFLPTEAFFPPLGYMTYVGPSEES